MQVYSTHMRALSTLLISRVFSFFFLKEARVTDFSRVT